MNISKLICGIAALTLLTDVALAAPNHQALSPAQLSSTAPAKHQPKRLNDAQMDKVTAAGIFDAFGAVVSEILKNSQGGSGDATPGGMGTYLQARAGFMAAVGFPGVHQ